MVAHGHDPIRFCQAMIRYRSRLRAALVALGIVPLIAALNGYADVPLTVEGLLSGGGVLRVEASALLSVREEVAPDGSHHYSDGLFGSLALRYGLTPDTELALRGSGTIHDTRSIDFLSGVQSKVTSRFQSVSVAASYRLLADTTTPGVLTFLEIDLLQNIATDGNEFVPVRSGMLGFTIHRTIDPVLLSLTGGYRMTLPRVVSNQTVDPGDTVFLNPGIGFAVNNEVTLTGSAHLAVVGEDIFEGAIGRPRHTIIKTSVGVGLSWSRDLTVRLDLRADASGKDGAEVALTANYRLLGPYVDEIS